MWNILITLIIGFFIGYFKIIPKKFLPVTQWITTGGLVVLLVSMGAGLSSNSETLSKISQLGFKALLMACFTICGSILFVWFLERYLFHDLKGDVGQEFTEVFANDLNTDLLEDDARILDNSTVDMGGNSK